MYAYIHICMHIYMINDDKLKKNNIVLLYRFIG